MSPSYLHHLSSLVWLDLKEKMRELEIIYSLYMEVIKIKVIVWTGHFCVPTPPKKETKQDKNSLVYVES